MAPSDGDYVRVDIPTDDFEEDDNDRARPPSSSSSSSAAAAAAQDEEGASSSSHHSPSSRGRTTTSLLRTLWSEATSTTDLPPPPPAGDHRLHHRRAHAVAGANASSSSAAISRATSSSAAARYPRGGRGGGGGSTMSSSSSSSSRHAHHHRAGGGGGRGARVAKRVWLAAFSAFGASFVVGVHLFLYRTFLAGGGDVGVGRRDDDIRDGDDRAATMTKNGVTVLAAEDRVARMTMDEARSRILSPVSAGVDVDGYTVRINTWRRNEQLLLSLNHHAMCGGVMAIHVVWCDSERDPPDAVTNHPSGKVRVERHVINSLNERFRVLIEPPTLGVLSLDDDVMRPCAALDAAFVRWTRHPDRMVGFDARTHVVVEGGGEDDGGKERKHVPGTKGGGGGDHDHDDDDGKSRWKYGYMSTTEASNMYSMTLPRASFLHRDYLDLYTDALPRPIYSYVAANLECEDVAMSFLVSSLTDGKPPLLADYWAVKSMVKLYSESKISGGKDHKATRDACVNDFAEMLGLREDGDVPLQLGKLLHGGSDKQFFGYGAEAEEWTAIDDPASERLLGVVRELRELRTSSSKEERMGWLMRQKATAQAEAQGAGMIEGTREWKERWAAGAKRI